METIDLVEDDLCSLLAELIGLGFRDVHNPAVPVEQRDEIQAERDMGRIGSLTVYGSLSRGFVCCLAQTCEDSVILGNSRTVKELRVLLSLMINFVQQLEGLVNGTGGLA